VDDAARLVFGAFLPAFGLSALLVRWAARLALAVNLVAPVRPDRLHTQERPYGGGLAIMATLAVIVGAACLAAPLCIGKLDNGESGYWDTARSLLAGEARLLPRLAVGAVLFFMIGMIDDRYAMPALSKLFLQFAAAAVVVATGLSATVWLTAPHAGEVVSILWIVAVVNAYNMFDHADGVAGAAGLVALAALAAGQILMGQWLVPAIALVAAGALAGFLTGNLPPARLFMGDAGSSLVGYLLAALTILAQYYFRDRGTGPWVVLVPLAILAVPLFDMVCVTLGRLWRHQSPFRGDATSHLAHRMLARGSSPRMVVLFAAAMAAMTGGASIIMYYVQGWMLLVPWGIVAAALVMMLLARRRPKARATA
jgi:UDP-GlcNAc:undecaprenyl-phosphate GlcNAc-1-phosphate transferase